MRLSLIFALSVMCCQPALAACGDKGGPGYRNNYGKCVGWEALARQCGKPQERGTLYMDIDEWAFQRLVGNCAATLREALAH